MATASGLNDFDYQSLTTLSMGLKNLNQIETSSKIPIPPEVMEHFNRKFTSINIPPRTYLQRCVALFQT